MGCNLFYNGVVYEVKYRCELSLRWCSILEFVKYLIVEFLNNFGIFYL